MRTLHLLLAASLAAQAAAWNTGVAAQPGGIEWLRVSDDVLSGKGVGTPIESAKALERQGSTDTAPILRNVVFTGQLRTSVVQMQGDTIHLPSFPDDEVFCVIVGSLILTSDETKTEQVFYPGDCGFVPKGWAGVWRNPDVGVYRELATVPASYSFDVSLESNPPVKGARAFALEAPRTVGTHQLHSGTFVLETENAAREETRSVSLRSDETIQILKGNLTLKSGNKTEIFKPGDVVILPKGLNAQMRLSAGYKAFVVRVK